MPLFLHVHDAPGASADEIMEAHLEDVRRGNERGGVDYRRYWFDGDAGRFFCLVEAPSSEIAVEVHAAGHGLLPTEVYTVREGLRDRRDYDAMRILFAGTLEPDSNCIDVGCNRGVLLREMVRCAPEGAHIAFEPIPDLAAALAAEFPQVEIRQAALASRPGAGTFAHFRERPGYSHLVDHADRVAAAAPELLTVPVESLDCALPDGHVPALIKVDVEGAELEVLKGAQETLARHRPIVLFEHGAGRPEVSKELFDLLSEVAGLRLYDIDGNGPMRRQRFLDVLAGLEIWNFVARR